MDRDRLVVFVALGEIVALEHARHRVPRREANHVGRGFRPVPGRVEADFGRVRIENLEHLRLVGLGIFLNLFRRQRWSGRRFAARVADHAGKVTDQEHDVVPEILELAHLVDQHGMTEVQIRRGRIEAGLDSQRLAAANFFLQFSLEQYFITTAFYLLHCIFLGNHAIYLSGVFFWAIILI